jgi:hypothetical protein
MKRRLLSPCSAFHRCRSALLERTGALTSAGSYRVASRVKNALGEPDGSGLRRTERKDSGRLLAREPNIQIRYILRDIKAQLKPGVMTLVHPKMAARPSRYRKSLLLRGSATNEAHRIASDLLKAEAQARNYAWR